MVFTRQSEIARSFKSPLFPTPKETIFCLFDYYYYFCKMELMGNLSLQFYHKMTLFSHVLTTDHSGLENTCMPLFQHNSRIGYYQIANLLSWNRTSFPEPFSVYRQICQSRLERVSFCFQDEKIPE